MSLAAGAKRTATQVKITSIISSRKKQKVEVAVGQAHVNTASAGDMSTAFSAAALESLEQNTMGDSWRGALDQEFAKPYFRKLKEFLLSEYKSGVIYPPMHDIYSWSRLTPLQAVKVVVLGQDPYHGKGQAHGLAFSVLPPTKPPPSLKNIYKQIAADFPSFKPPSATGDLTPLAEAGVLWLNAVLTVRSQAPNTHQKKGWEEFTAAVLRAVISRKGAPGVVFMAWGLPAQKTIKTLGVDEKEHLVLRSAHPSPLSAHRGFLGNEHFRLANEWLERKYGEGKGIDWTAI